MYVIIYAMVYLVQSLGGGEIENPRGRLHDSKGGDKDREIVHTALKRIITLGKADVLTQPSWSSSRRIDGEDLTMASLSKANAAAEEGFSRLAGFKGSRGSGGTKGTKGAKAAKEDDRLAAVSEESEV